MGIAHAHTKIGRSKKTVVAINNYYPDGTCDVVFETTLPNGMPRNITRRVSLDDILPPTPVQDAIEECRHLVLSLSDLIQIGVEELLPLSDSERAEIVRQRLASVGVFNLRQAKEALARKDTRNLVKLVAVICLLNMTDGSDSEQCGIRRVATSIFLKQERAANSKFN